MKHPDTRALYDYWNAIRQSRAAPLRSDLSPRDMKPLLSRTFILQRDTDRCYTYRLAGTELCRFFGRELRGHNFLANWQRNEMQSVGSLFQSVTADMTAAVIGVKGFDDDVHDCLMEFVLLPVCLDGSDQVRILGCAGIFEPPAWVGRHPIVRQELVSLRLMWPQTVSRFLDPAHRHHEAPQDILPQVRPDSHKRGHLWVIDGGGS
jgi:hypothetical protein